jgi:hypothetical protein
MPLNNLRVFLMSLQSAVMCNPSFIVETASANGSDTLRLRQRNLCRCSRHGKCYGVYGE